MQKPNKKQRKTLERAVALYQEHAAMAMAYLSGRGVAGELADAMRLGVVITPEAGHEFAAGRLVIPYLDMQGVYSLKFRCMIDHDCKAENCKKYLGLPGQEAGLYNVIDTESTADTIHIAEGELDTLILKQVFPEHPAVGLPGSSTWRPHHPFHFGGFERVLVWADGDQAGRHLGREIRKDVRAAEIVPVPDGFDATSLFLAIGAEGMRKMVGEEEE